MSKQYFDQSYISGVTDETMAATMVDATMVDDDESTEPITNETENDGYGETEVLRPAGFEDARRDPVVGWLVCISGTELGADFRIHEGWNTIGRDPSNDIVINDPAVSADKMCTLLYDDPTKAFIIARGNGRNPSRINGRPLVSEKELAPFDHLTIGNTELIFVPLCGEQFSWESFRKDNEKA
ncbi:MAG: FHA domain-containing protein [Clostridia bacterium]|nr:FHA domain-containing protein [Clostridia bacterium]